MVSNCTFETLLYRAFKLCHYFRRGPGFVLLRFALDAQLFAAGQFSCALKVFPQGKKVKVRVDVCVNITGVRMWENVMSTAKPD